MQPKHDHSRDPFGGGPGPIDQTGTAVALRAARKSLIPLFILALIVGGGGGYVGYTFGKGYEYRTEHNITLRDAMIIEYEILKATKIFDELETVIDTALLKASKSQEFDEHHIPFIKANLTKNPVKRIIRLTLPMLKKTFICADNLILAMESRCYTDNRTDPEFTASGSEYFFLSGSAIIALGFIFL